MDAIVETLKGLLSTLVSAFSGLLEQFGLSEYLDAFLTKLGLGEKDETPAE